MEQLTKRLRERVLGAEMTHYLGYEKGNAPKVETDQKRENHRNGKKQKDPCQRRRIRVTSKIFYTSFAFTDAGIVTPAPSATWRVRLGRFIVEDSDVPLSLPFPEKDPVGERGQSTNLTFSPAFDPKNSLSSTSFSKPPLTLRGVLTFEMQERQLPAPLRLRFAIVPTINGAEAPICTANT
jgi:hypothetical protein